MKNSKYYSYLMSLGHFCSDINQGALSAILPFLIAAYHYDYSTAAMLVMAANITGSIVQPLFGQLADKKNLPWLIGVGLFLAGGGMAVTGFTNDFSLLYLAVIVSGIGIAMFHPQAARLVNKASNQNNKGKNTSIFAFGGTLGFTFGPLIATSAIVYAGLKGTAVFIAPAVIMFGVILLLNAPLKKLGMLTAAKNAHSSANADDNWPAFYKLTAVIFSRSILYYGFNTFLALYFIDKFNVTEAEGTLILSIFYAAGAASTLFGGYLGDKYGYTTVVKTSFAILLPGIILLSLMGNLYAAVLLLLPISAALNISYSPQVVLGQQYLPNRVGLASGVTLGLAVSVGGIFTPLLGLIADNYSLLTVLYALAGIAVIPTLVSMFLPAVK